MGKNHASQYANFGSLPNIVETVLQIIDKYIIEIPYDKLR